MPIIYIGNSFCMDMLNKEVQTRKITDGNTIGYPRIPIPFNSMEEVKEFIKERKEKDPESEIVSTIHYTDTAEVLSKLLEIELTVNKTPVKFSKTPGEIMIVAQYNGPWVNEPPYVIPQGFSIDWWRI